MKVATFNGGGGFAGHGDWRVPNIKELQSIVNYQNINPAVSPVFHTGCTPGCTVTTCSCTQSNSYWSSSSDASTPSEAWDVYFDSGDGDATSKASSSYVRAVRGGL